MSFPNAMFAEAFVALRVQYLNVAVFFPRYEFHSSVRSTVFPRVLGRLFSRNATRASPTGPHLFPCALW